MKRIILETLCLLLVLSISAGGKVSAAEMPPSSTEVVEPDAVMTSMAELEPQMDPALTFDWKLLLEQNDMNNILRWYSGVRV